MSKRTKHILIAIGAVLAAAMVALLTWATVSLVGALDTGVAPDVVVIVGAVLLALCVLSGIGLLLVWHHLRGRI